MIQRALNYYKDRIDLYCFRNTDNPDKGLISQKNILTPKDWEDLRVQSELLHPFYQLTQRLEDSGDQKSYGCVWEVLPGIEILLTKLEKAKEIYKSNKFLSESINMGWKKL